MLNISYSYFSLKAMHDLAGQLVQMVKTAHGDDGMLLAATERIDKQMKLAQQVINNSESMDLTAALAEADQARDDGFMALRDTIAACLRRLNPEVRRAAERLFPVFGRNDAQLHVLPYDEETMAMDNLFSDLQIPQFEKDVALVGAGPALQELKDAQAHFVHLYEANIKPDEDRSDLEAKGELKGALEVLISVLNTLAALNRLEGISETTDQIKKVIDGATAEAKG
ncbi:MAG: DUF6261 family protein [Bacteroidota bacterium]